MAPLTAWLLTEAFDLSPDGNSMLQAGGPLWARLPEELLVAVFNALDPPTYLVRCAFVCKAWRIGTAKAALPVLNLRHSDLRWLLHLSDAQMAAVRDVHMRFSCQGGSPSGWTCDANGVKWDSADATASIMLLTFICGRASMLRRLELTWGDNLGCFDVSCTADALHALRDLFNQKSPWTADFVWQKWHHKMICAMLPSSLHALDFAGTGRVSLPDLRRLTALTELRLDMALLTPTGGQLPHFAALRVLSLIGSSYWPWPRGDHDLQGRAPRSPRPWPCAFGVTPC